MTLIQGAMVAQIAKSKGYAVRAENGRVQLVKVTYDANGKSTVTEASGWMGYEDAMVFASNAK